MELLKKKIDCRCIFAFVLTAVFIGSLAHQYLIPPNPWTNDFYPYFFAAQSVRDNLHADIYSGASENNPQGRPAPMDSPLAQHAVADGFNGSKLYIYPPLLADLLTPLTFFSPAFALCLWSILNLSLVFLTVALLARLARIRWMSIEFGLLAITAYYFYPLLEAIHIGQVTVVLLALWTLAIAAYARERMVLSAFAISLASAIKITPVMVVPLFFLWKERRWVIAYLSSVLALFVGMFFLNGPQSLIACARTMSAMSMGIPEINNKSFGSLIAWLYYRRTFLSLFEANRTLATAPHGLILLMKLTQAVLYIFLLYLIWRQRKSMNRASRTVAISIFVLATTSLAPVSWTHGYTISLMPLTLYWTFTLRYRQSLYRGLLLGAATLAQCAYFERIAVTPIPGLCSVFLASLWVILCFAFCVDALIHLPADADRILPAGWAAVPPLAS